MKKMYVILLLSFSLFGQSSKALFHEDFMNRIQLEKNDEIKLTADPVKKSPFLGAVYSFLLPGMGELYSGDYGTGKYFTIAEAFIWGGFAGFSMYGDWQKENYIAYAASTGGVTTDGKDEEFFARIGEYPSVFEYNRISRLNRDFDETYDEQVYFWDWKTDAARKEYRNTWVSSEQAYNNVRFAVGAMIINRIVSIINAVRHVNSFNRSIQNSDQISISATYLPQGNSSMIRLNFYGAF